MVEVSKNTNSTSYFLKTVEDKIESMSHQDLLVEHDQFDIIKTFITFDEKKFKKGRLCHKNLKVT